MEEVWKDVIEYEDMYQISNFGRLKRKSRVDIRIINGKPRNYKMTEKIIKPHLKPEGYYRYTLNKDRNRKHEYAHRLVAQHFIDKPLDFNETLYVVNHKDGNKKHNVVDNLEWVTISENSLHAIHTLNIKPNTKGIYPPRKVHQIDLHTGIVINEFETITLAQKETGVGHISSVCRGYRNKAGGFFWKYA